MPRLHLIPEVPPEVDHLGPFVDAGVLSAVDVAFGAFVEALLGPGLTTRARRWIVLAAALASRAPQRGHVAVDLRSVAATATVDVTQPVGETGGPSVDELDWPDPEAWCRLFRSVDVVGGSGAKALAGIVAPAEPVLNVTGDSPPLLYRDGLLYLDRYFRYECDVAQRLRAMDIPLADPISSGAAEHLFEGPGLQRSAVAHALGHRLSILAGGPGTGKTFTLTRFLVALLRARPDSTVALAAPTGKAASRMKAAMIEAAGDLSDDLADRVTSLETSTVHRLLGVGDGIRFRHDDNHPLPHDVVIVDEVSMVSLPLMSRLLRAIKPDGRLLLVGDPNQLASVEAGAVLGDVTSTAGSLVGSVTTLTDARRFAVDSGIHALAEAIRRGQVDSALDLLHGTVHPDVRLVDPDRAGDVLATAVEQGRAALAEARRGNVVAAADLAGGLKVLCALRRGPNGRDRWQHQIETGVLSATTDRVHRGRWYVGRPLIVTVNDYLLNLFNGDTGIVALEDRQRRLFFPGSANPEGLPPQLLDNVDTWWAMTIHKSQGSEFDHAIVCLPEQGSAILTRELLYTGVTRARREVTLVATEQAVASAIRTPIRRATGLSRLLDHP